MRSKSIASLGKPSKREMEVFLFITKFQRKRRYAPSLAEIATHFKVSIPTIHQHVAALRDKDFISAEKNRKRSIKTFNDHEKDLVEIPLMGLIAAGKPIEPIRNPESIEVPRSMLSRNAKHYALQVVGTSMIEELIDDGDIVIVREQPTVENGEKAVAYLPDENAVTLKKIYWENNRVKLVPANYKMKPLYAKHVIIQGKVVGVLRRED